MSAIDFGTALIWFTVFLFSTTVHEAAHAFVAWRLGDPTAYHGGQVSLNPAPHVAREPIGMLVLPLLTSLTQGWALGWASAPYDPHWAARYPRRAAIMSAAGPVGNLLIAVLALSLLKIGLGAGWFIAPDRVSFNSLVEMASGTGPSFLTTLLSVFLVLNVFLGVFNLIPLPPLDGASVITLFLPESLGLRMRDLATNAMFSIVGLFVAWQIFPVIVRPLFTFVLVLVHPSVGYGQ